MTCHFFLFFFFVLSLEVPFDVYWRRFLYRYFLTYFVNLERITHPSLILLIFLMNMFVYINVLKVGPNRLVWPVGRSSEAKYGLGHHLGWNSYQTTIKPDRPVGEPLIQWTSLLVQTWIPFNFLAKLAQPNGSWKPSFMWTIY